MLLLSRREGRPLFFGVRAHDGGGVGVTKVLKAAGWAGGGGGVVDG